MNGIRFAAMTSTELAAKNTAALNMLSRIETGCMSFTSLTIEELSKWAFENQNEIHEDSGILADIDDCEQTQLVTVGEYAFKFQLSEEDEDGVPCWTIVDYIGCEQVSIH